jgi:hypothetical protein
MYWSRSQAEQALKRLTDLLAGLGLEPKAAKTRSHRTHRPSSTADGRLSCPA